MFEPLKVVEHSTASTLFTDASEVRGEKKSRASEFNLYGLCPLRALPRRKPPVIELTLTPVTFQGKGSISLSSLCLKNISPPGARRRLYRVIEFAPLLIHHNDKNNQEKHTNQLVCQESFFHIYKHNPKQICLCVKAKKHQGYNFNIYSLLQRKSPGSGTVSL